MRGRGYSKAVVTLVSLFAASYISGGLIPYLLFYIGFGLFLADFSWSLTCKRAEVNSWIESPESSAGTRVKVFTRIENNSPWPIPWIQIWIEMPGTFCLPDNLCCYTFSLGAYECKVVSEELECKIRGKFEWGRGVIKGGGFLNVFTCSGTFGEPGELEVLPKFSHLGGLGIRGRNKKASEGLSIRKYDAGDSLSRVHWKLSARTQHLLVKSQQKPEHLNTVICLDNGRERHFDDGYNGSFEQAVSLTASIAAALAEAGHSLGLVFTSLSAVVPQQLRRINFGYGRAHFKKMLKQLTLITCVEDSVLSETIGKVTQESAKTHLILISGEL
ncbi:MAG TPA: DUF58 domain-containing protein, partial [Desulfobacteria bacterium]|nr:DUF58 domain-containing protein [Desulfobacteria bacterium]